MGVQLKGIPLFTKEKYHDAIWGSRILFYSRQILRGAVGGAIILFFLVGALNWPDFRWLGIIAFVMVLALVIVLLERRSTYLYNRCILTDRRVIDIRRRHLFGRATHRETQYDIIREVEVSDTFFDRLFHIGTLHIIVTLPTLHDICLGRVDDPKGKQFEILNLRNQFVP